MSEIVDYSSGYPGGKAIKDAGYEGVIRYLKKEGDSHVKPLTAAEVEDMFAHGRTVSTCYQHVSQGRPGQGRAAGEHDAEWALKQARACGIEPRCIYFCVDYDAEPNSVAEYFKGTSDVLGVGKNGAYGSYRVVKYLLDMGLVSRVWQTVAWSGGKKESRAHLFQKSGYVHPGGITCDENDVLQSDYGQLPWKQDSIEGSASKKRYYLNQH